MRGWASRELGKSLIFSLTAKNNKFSDYVLLMSELDTSWILLKTGPDIGTCYHDRGDYSAAGVLPRKK